MEEISKPKLFSALVNKFVELGLVIEKKGKRGTHLYLTDDGKMVLLYFGIDPEAVIKKK